MFTLMLINLKVSNLVSGPSIHSEVSIFCHQNHSFLKVLTKINYIFPKCLTL